MNKVSNENLRKALVLRAAEKYTEGLVYLKQACDEGDGVALAFLGLAYRWGGWGVEINDAESCVYLRHAYTVGYEPAAALSRDFTLTEERESLNPIRRAIAFCDAITLYELSKEDVCIAPVGVASWIHGVVNSNLDLTHLIALNDAYVNCYIARTRSSYSEREPLLKRSSDQGFTDAYYHLITEYYQNDKHDLAAPYVIKKGFGNVSMRCGLMIQTNPARLRELYLYGEYYFKSGVDDRDTKTVDLYKNTKAAVSNALIAWWIVAKRIWLYADLRRLITEYVLKSAKDPSVWPAPHKVHLSKKTKK